MRRAVLALALLFWAAALCFADLAQKSGEGVFIQLDRGITASEAQQIFAREAQERTPTGLCFYTVREGERLYCRENGQSAEAAVVAVAGNSALLGAETLSWTQGCAVDSRTAQTLFGTAAVGSRQIFLGNKTRTVTQTVSALSATVLVWAEAEESLDQCVLALWDENGGQAAQAFLLRHGLSGQVLHFYPLLVFTKNFCLLPLWVLLAYLCRLAGRRAKWLGWLTAIVGIAVLGSSVIVPGDAIPSVWSDFSFWGNWMRGQKENLLRIFAWPAVDRALQMEQNMIKSMLCTLAGTFAAAVGGRR